MGQKELAKKYYLMSCDNNLPEAYNNMGLYYCEIDNNIEIGKLYFIQSIISDMDNINNIKNKTSHY